MSLFVMFITSIPKNLRALKTNFEKADGLGIRHLKRGKTGNVYFKGRKDEVSKKYFC